VVRPDGVGLGLVVNVAPRTASELPLPGGTARLYTSFQVREDTHALFGFGSSAERDLFEALLKISGVGGKTALAILDLPRDRIVAAIAAGDYAVLQQVPGVGPKTAGRIVLELKDRFAQELMEEWADTVGTRARAGLPPEITPAAFGGEFVEAVEALVELGFQRTDAREQVRRARASLGDGAPPEDLVRHVLQRTG
jgi:Holliday junction DNA helicase RuvA